MAATAKKKRVAAAPARKKRAAASTQKKRATTPAPKQREAVPAKKKPAASSTQKKRPPLAAAKKKAAAGSAPKKGAAPPSQKKREPASSNKKRVVAPAPKKLETAPAPKKRVATSAQRKHELDFSAFPPGAVVEHTTRLCLACIFDLFTKQFGLAPRTASSEIKRHSPTVEELTATAPSRPYFHSDEPNPRCPYCDSAKRWHARLDTFRIESGTTTDAARRALTKSLAKTDEQFQIVETKSTRRAMFFEWLDALGHALDFDASEAWMTEATRAFLERREPKTNWAEIFAGVRAVRRSQRLAEGWERDGSRLFLAPPLYNDALLVQYLVSRSHKHGGRTLEGRLTLPELVRRMRYSGHLNALGLSGDAPFDVLEKLVEHLAGGGDSTVKLHYITDRRDLLEKVKTVYARYAAM